MATPICQAYYACSGPMWTTPSQDPKPYLWFVLRSVPHQDSSFTMFYPCLEQEIRSWPIAILKRWLNTLPASSKAAASTYGCSVLLWDCLLQEVWSSDFKSQAVYDYSITIYSYIYIYICIYIYSYIYIFIYIYINNYTYSPYSLVGLLAFPPCSHPRDTTDPSNFEVMVKLCSAWLCTRCTRCTRCNPTLPRWCRTRG